MNQSEQNNQNRPAPPDRTEEYYQEPFEDEINLVDLVYPIYKHVRFLILFCFLVVLTAGILSIRQTKTYEASATILPEPRQTGGGLSGPLGSAVLDRFGMGGLGAGLPSPSEVFSAILKSRELAAGVIKRSRYDDIMGLSNMERAVDALLSSLKVDNPRDLPTLAVKLQSDNPVLAADLINTYLRELDVYNRTFMVTSARRLIDYIETRLQVVDQELEEAQQELREFQEKHRAVSISRQADATVSVLSDMEVRRVSLEVELAAKEQFYRGPHIEIEQLKAQMAALQKNIDRLTYSQEEEVPVEREKGKVEFYIPLIRIPTLSFDESKLLLKVKAKTGVVNMLTTELEQAKLDEAKDMPTVNVLDWARPPELPIKPRIKLNVVLAFVVSLFLGVFIIFFWEFLHRLDQDPEVAPKWREMKGGIKRPFSFFKRKDRN